MIPERGIMQPGNSNSSMDLMASHNGTRPLNMPAPRNRMRSGSSIPLRSPPLRSVTEITSTVGRNRVEHTSSALPVSAADQGRKSHPLDNADMGAEGSHAGASKVPAFLNKLYSMINDISTDQLIYWSPEGASFFIPNTQDFGRELLPQFFKHANFTSFVRQLNMYGFKKVPHLQAGTMNTFPQPTNELWEFSNPKFHRDHPDWLASITRKKSAKEIAAAAALASQTQPGLTNNVDSGSKSFGAGANISGPLSKTHGSTSSPVDTGNASRDQTDSQSLNTAMTIMKDTHSSLEREMAELKASNELLWRQAMISRDEQLKSQKKLDGVMRFLAGQFGNMNMALLEDENESASATSIGQTNRISRLGKGRMIGDGVSGLDGATSDEDMDDESELWEKGDEPEPRQFWEVDDDGKMVKVSQTKSERPNLASRTTSSKPIMTPTRSSFAIPRLPGPARKPDASPSKRFERVDGSPEETSRNSFIRAGKRDNKTESSEAVNKSGRLFPLLSKPSDPPIASNRDLETKLHPNENNALALQDSDSNNGPYTLDSSILDMPLGTLLSSPAGAQLLATLGQSAASFLGNPESSGRPPAEDSRFTDATSQIISPGDNPSHENTPASLGVLPNNNATMTGLEGDAGWMSETIGQPPGVPDHLARPFLDNSSPQAFTSATMLQEGVGLDASALTGQAADFDWSDPAVEALLQAFESQNQPQQSDHVEPNMFTNDDQYDDIFGMIQNAESPAISAATETNPSAATSNAGDLGDTGVSHDVPISPATEALFAGPTRKKRKTDQREA